MSKGLYCWIEPDSHRWCSHVSPNAFSVDAPLIRTDFIKKVESEIESCSPTLLQQYPLSFLFFNLNCIEHSLLIVFIPNKMHRQPHRLGPQQGWISWAIYSHTINKKRGHRRVIFVARWMIYFYYALCIRSIRAFRSQ